MEKYAVITGASSGIGKEFAKQLSSDYHLILIARRKERLMELSKQLGTPCDIICADLSDIQACQEILDLLKNKNVEIFINNAGFGDCGEFLETDLDKEMQMIDVNIKALHYLTKGMLKQMEEARKGSILNVASCAGLMPAGPYMSTYYATKSYVTSLTRGIAEELEEKRSPVYIGCLCPGPVDTEFNEVANVKFALPGIQADYCAAYALRLK